MLASYVRPSHGKSRRPKPANDGWFKRSEIVWSAVRCSPMFLRACSFMISSALLADTTRPHRDRPDAVGGLDAVCSRRCYGVTLLDPVAFAGAAAILGMTALRACVTPALLAVRTDLAVTLRQE